MKELNKNEIIRITKICKLVGEGKTVLNIGSKKKDPLTIALRSLKNKVLTIDLSNSDIKWNLENGLPKKMLQYKFDCVVAGEVLEHLVNFKKVIYDIARVTTTVVLSVPNILSFRNRIFAILGKDLVYSAFWYPENRHVNDFSLNRIKRTLEEVNFNIEKVETTGIVFGKFCFPTLLKTFGDVLIIRAKKSILNER